MRRRLSCRSRSPLWGLLLGSLCLGLTPAWGQSYEFELEKLQNPGSSSDADPNFHAFARLVGAAITSASSTAPDTLGASGFAVTAETSIVNLKAAALPTVDTLRGPLLLPSLHIRKGLPWSFELGARAAWVQNSRMAVVSAELRWAINEGYTYLPEIAARVHFSKLVNARDLNLGAGGLDLSVGKRFAIAGTCTLTPYVGWNVVYVGAASGYVDFKPQASVREANAPPGEQYGVNIQSFSVVTALANSHSRFYGGLRFVVGVFQLGGEVSYSLLRQVGSQGLDESVLATNVSLGLQF